MTQENFYEFLVKALPEKGSWSPETAQEASSWFYDTAGDSIVAFDFDSGTVFSEDGASPWFKAYVLTPRCLLVLSCEARPEDEDEDMPSGTSLEFNYSVVPLKHVLQIGVHEARGKDRELVGISAHILLSSQDYSEHFNLPFTADISDENDEEEEVISGDVTRNVIHHDVVHVVKSVDTDKPEDIARSSVFVRALTRLMSNL